MKNKRKWWLTIVEVIIVVLIMWILLWITIGLWNSYVRTMQVKKDKEQFESMIENFLAIARTSNYHRGERYTTLTVQMDTWSVVWTLDSWTTVDSLSLASSQLILSWGSFSVDLTPYQLWCQNGVLTWTEFQLDWIINNDEYCFLRDFRVCKLQLQVCP